MSYSLTFLGSGSAFYPVWEGNFQSNMIITSPSGKRLLIDCGTNVHQSLHKQGLSIFDIDAIYISHLHADHVGGLEETAFKTYFNPNAPKPKLYGNGKMLEFLWSDTLKGGLASIQGKIVTLNDYFDVKPVSRNSSFIWEDVEFTLIRTIHIMDGFDFVPSYGLMFVLNGKKVFLTTDAQHCPNQINDFYNMSDIIFQDCETSPFKSGVHAHYTELKTLPDDIKNKMWLYHFQFGELPDAKNDGFQGFVSMGQVFI
jgi:ribonuclease BN (tRNA processing enzyme)